MNDDIPARISKEQLELYLDGQLSLDEAAAVERLLPDDVDAASSVDLQRRIDEHLRASFMPPAISDDQIGQWLANDRDSAINAKTHSRRRILQLVIATFAVAASIAFAVVQWGDDSGIKPFFKPRALTEIYRETVEQGFRPYYFCEDADRFALTFAKRQKTPLELAKLPPDRRMIGLSYPGGLSRDTTAMLGYANDQPVVVFIDRKQFADDSIASADAALEIYVHRQELEDLVMYEVSPLPTPMFTDFLRLQSPSD